MYEIRKYHGDRVMSLTYDDEDQSFSVGIIAPGEYEFGAIRMEVFTVTSGTISVRIEEEGDWITYSLNETFTIPGHSNFSLKADQVSAYICYYE